MLKQLLTICLPAGFFLNCSAQELVSPSFTFSHKKTAYVTLKDGSEIKGSIDELVRKKGLVVLVKIEDGNGEKHKLKAESVNYMYLPPSGLDNYVKATDFLTDAQKWNNDKLNQDFLNQGYAYFESSNVKIKKKQRVMIMQLLNPTFSKTVKVYHDPFAKETMSAGVGGVTLAGGHAKSYYIRIGDDAAFKLEKKSYAKQFVPLWSKCEALKSTTDIQWKDLSKHIVQYTDCVQ